MKFMYLLNMAVWLILWVVGLASHDHDSVIQGMIGFFAFYILLRLENI